MKWDFLLPIVPYFAYCKLHAEFLARTARKSVGATRTFSTGLHQTSISSSEERGKYKTTTHPGRRLVVSIDFRVLKMPN